jgi:cell wall-associated NlpC family hydrolase
VRLTGSPYHPRSCQPGWRTTVAAVLSLAALGAGAAYVGQPEHHSSTAIRPAADTAAVPAAPDAANLPPNKYDAAGAAAWARANINSGSPYGYRDDCTDFVSRAMHLGGKLPFYDNGIPPWDHTDDRNWYMQQFGSEWKGTYSWGAANHLDTFVRLAGIRQAVTPQQAKPGDLIFVNWGPGGRDTPANNPSGEAGIDHVGMVVGNPGKQGGYNLSIAQHTSDTIETLADWRKPNPNLQVWVYSIYLG